MPKPKKHKRQMGMIGQSILNFDSFFECGNLDMAHKINDTEYDLYMRVDSNTHGHNQWFYFKVIPSILCHIKFRIVNFTKKESLYSMVNNLIRE